MTLQYINITSGTETYRSTYSKINNNISEQFISGTYSNEILTLNKFNGNVINITGFTSNNNSGGISGLTYSDVVNALGYIPLSSSTEYSGLTVTGDLSGSTLNNNLILILNNSTIGNNNVNNITYNNKGLIISGNNINYIQSSFTESNYYKLTNPNSYISGITYNNVINALGYTPLSSSTAGRINIVDFGVKGDGTDETINMQIAINSGLPLYIPSNMVIRANGLICTTDLDIEGYGTILNKYSSVTLTWRPSWGVQTNINGVISSTTRVIGGGFVSKIPVVNSSGFTINRVCQIRSQDIYSFAGITTARKAELFRILDIENNYIWVHGLIEDDYPTNPIIQELPTNKCHINGLTFSADGDIYNIPASPEEAAVIIQGSVDAFINIKVDTCWTRGLFMLSDFNSIIKVVARNIRDYTNNNQYGYGVSLAGSSHGANVYIDAEKCRHAITSNIYSDFGPAWNGTPRKAIISGVARRMTSAAWDTHPGAMNWTFRNIIAIDGEYDRDAVGIGRRQGFQDRGFQTVVDGLQIIGQTDGIYYDNIDYGKQNISIYRNVTIKYKDQNNSIDCVGININGVDSNTPKIIIENWNTDRVRETLRTTTGVTIVMRNCYFGESVSMDIKNNNTTLENITRQNSNITGSDVMDNIAFDNNALIRADSIRHFGKTRNGNVIFRGYGTLSGTTNLYLGLLTNWYTSTSDLYYNPNNMNINIIDTQVLLPKKYIQIPENTTQAEITSGMLFMQNGIPKGRFLSETMNNVMYRGSTLQPTIAPKYSGEIWGKTGSSNDIWFGMDSNSVSDWKKIQLVAGGTTVNRPISGETYEMYFDSTLGKPIWRDSTNTSWVEPSTKLNDITTINQYLTTGSTGSDFNIISSGNTHFFNIPTASSSTTRGLLSGTDWINFNNKQDNLGYIPYNSNNISGFTTSSFTENNYYRLTNPNQYINFISGDTKYYLNTNPNNYIQSSFTENRYYKSTNPNNYISSITYNNVVNALNSTTLPTILPISGGTIAIINDVLFPIMCSAPSSTYMSSTTYYLGSCAFTGVITTTANQRIMQIPFNATLVGASIGIRSGTAGSSETSSVYMRVNNTTDVLISNNVLFNTSNTNQYTNSLNTNVTAGDTYEIKITTGAFTTIPLTTFLTVILYFKRR